jgi:hypothetical protein
VPPRDWLSVPLTLEQFLSARPLRIPGISDFEPCTGLSVGNVRRILLFGNNAFQIVLARLLESRHSCAIHIINVLDSSLGTAQQPPQLLLAIQQAFAAAILAVTHEQVECEKARIVSTMKKQIGKSWASFFVQRTNLSVDDD